MRLGLCCTFLREPIRFRNATARTLSGMKPRERTGRLRALAEQNAEALQLAIQYCTTHNIGSFRTNSQILPLRTHPRLGYAAALLGEPAVERFHQCGELARRSGIRLTFHPDQFVVLGSIDPAVTTASLREIEHQAEVAEWIGADLIQIHGGGVYGDKRAALRRLAANAKRLSKRARARLALENDDRAYTPSDLLPVCRELGIPLVYDVHHHRCNPDGLSVEAATRLALSTWNREPLFHVSSPRHGWRGGNPRPHADTIKLKDFPRFWERLDCTVEVEAKSKELAVEALRLALRRCARRASRNDPRS